MPAPTPTTPNIVPLPPNFEPTPEEESLLALYATVKNYEREAAKLKEKAAKDKLKEANERYQREQERKNAAEGGEAGPSSGVGKPKKKRRAKKTKKSMLSENPASGDDESSGMEEGSDGDDEDAMANSDEEEDAYQRREEQLEKMREDVEDARQRAENNKEAEEEKLREEHLAEAATDDLGFSLKRKRAGMEKPASSLITSLSGQATPPHDFSKKLGMGKANLSGTVLFPTDQSIAAPASWSPPSSASDPNDGAFEVELKDFDATQAQVGSGPNTIGIKFSAPQDSKRFSLNIAGPGHRDYHDVLFHFNPRQHQKGGQLVVNDKQEGIWGQGVAVPLSQLPLIFGQVSNTLIIQINGDGFDVFLEGKHCARLEHRTQLPPNKCSLTLQFPSTDDYGKPENWSVYKVWWGHKAIMATGDLSGVAGVNIFSALHPKKLFINGLTRIHTEPEVDLRRAELERAFRKYGGAQGAIVTAPTNSTFAFVELESERQADLALTEMQSRYRMNRARRSKHEVLQEERAAAEAAKEGKVTESSEWD